MIQIIQTIHHLMMFARTFSAFIFIYINEIKFIFIIFKNTINYTLFLLNYKKNTFIVFYKMKISNILLI